MVARHGEEREAVEGRGRERKVDQAGRMEREEGRRWKRDGGSEEEMARRAHAHKGRGEPVRSPRWIGRGERSRRLVAGRLVSR